MEKWLEKEEYLKTKRNWIDQLASASGKKMSMENEIKWINLGLSSKLFASHIEKFSDESTRKATTMVKYLSRLRNVNAIRLGDDEEDMQMILDGRGFAIPLSKSKGFKQNREQFKRIVKCYNCDKPGHYAKDCPSKTEAVEFKGKCRMCNTVGHKQVNCPQAKEKDLDLTQGKMAAWGRSKMAKRAYIQRLDPTQIDPSVERVAVDSGSTTSAFTSQEYFIPGTCTRWIAKPPASQVNSSSQIRWELHCSDSIVQWSRNMRWSRLKIAN